jgi:AraC family L-rhamnose operon regulatory protein RhaS
MLYKSIVFLYKSIAVIYMKRFNSFHSINVFRLELEKWEYEVHKHNYYELVFIEQGSGKHLVNDLCYCYKERDIYLLTPDDAHEFNIDTKTKFIFLKFTEAVFLEKLSVNRKTFWENALKNVLQHYKVEEGCFVKNRQDKQHLFALMEVMLVEYSNKVGLFNNEVVLELFGSIMSIVTRNLSEYRMTEKAGDKNTELINSILTYIRMNAVDNEKMDIKNMSTHFSMSPNYISIFIKKHSGLSIQQHIIQTKIKSAEKLLKQNRFTVNEIADRLGFTDSSHFNKIFKKYKGVSPSEFVR